VPFAVYNPCCQNPTHADLLLALIITPQVVPLVYSMADDYWHCLVLADPPLVPRPVEARMGCRFDAGPGVDRWQMQLRFQGDTTWGPPAFGNVPICGPPFVWTGSAGINGGFYDFSVFE